MLENSDDGHTLSISSGPHWDNFKFNKFNILNLTNLTFKFNKFNISKYHGIVQRIGTPRKPLFKTFNNNTFRMLIFGDQ